MDSDAVAAAVTVTIVALAFLALILGLVTPTDTDLDRDSESSMVVHYACMACQSGCGTASYFTAYKATAIHYACSAPRWQACNQSVCPGHSHCGAAQQVY